MKRVITIDELEMAYECAKYEGSNWTVANWTSEGVKATATMSPDAELTIEFTPCKSFILANADFNLALDCWFMELVPIGHATQAVFSNEKDIQLAKELWETRLKELEIDPAMRIELESTPLITKG